jgi:hypothetical protein
LLADGRGEGRKWKRMVNELACRDVEEKHRRMTT